MQEWRDFFLLLASQTENDEFAAELNALAERVAALEASGGDLAMLIPGIGISINGLLTDPFVVIALDAFLSDLRDVFDAMPADGDRLTWDAALGEWKPASDSPQIFDRIDTSGDLRMTTDGALRITD